MKSTDFILLAHIDDCSSGIGRTRRSRGMVAMIAKVAATVLTIAVIAAYFC